MSSRIQPLLYITSACGKKTQPREQSVLMTDEVHLAFEIKAVFPDETALNTFTVYLFNREKKLLLPIKTTAWGSDSLIMALQGNPLAHPHIHDAFRRLLTFLGIGLSCALLYREADGIFYTYLRLIHNGIPLDLDIKAVDALCICIRMQSPIFVASDVAHRCSIKITKKLLEQSLTV